MNPSTLLVAAFAAMAAAMPFQPFNLPHEVPAGEAPDVPQISSTDLESIRREAPIIRGNGPGYIRMNTQIEVNRNQTIYSTSSPPFSSLPLNEQNDSLTMFLRIDMSLTFYETEDISTNSILFKSSVQEATLVTRLEMAFGTMPRSSFVPLEDSITTRGPCVWLRHRAPHFSSALSQLSFANITTFTSHPHNTKFCSCDFHDIELRSKLPPPPPELVDNSTPTTHSDYLSSSIQQFFRSTTSMAPSTAERTANGDSTAKIGPHPGFISSSNQYTSELKIRRMLKENGCDPAREDSYRLQGVQLIDNVREYLQLPVRTFDTACTYFHKFRLNFRDAEYNYQDAALASLFVACKVEDTIKKSKEILAASANVKNPDKPVAADDKTLEGPGKIIIGLERLILETIGFDFRTRYPQKLLVKIVRAILGKGDGQRFFTTAYTMCTDMYKTFVPIKRTTFSMVMAVVELTALMTGEHVDKVRQFAAQKRQYNRGAVMETMLDILDLYVQHHKSTKLGSQFDLNQIIDIKIRLNNDLDKAFEPRYLFHCTKCEAEVPQPLTPASATSPSTTTSWPGDASIRRTARGQDGTMRFVFDPDAARQEQETVGGYFKEEFEEYEVEVDEPVPPPPQHEGGRGGYRGGRDRGDHRRGGPYGGYRGDRHYRGRGRHY
ncbi:Fc.00g080310.m01.CDS01 [Cosmosporella sp. VM-42]